MSESRPSKPDVLDVDPDGVPEALKERDQWVLWSLTWKADREEWTKIPKQPNGAHASSTDADTWSSFVDVLSTYQGSDYDGIGFVLSEDGLVAGVDLDDCRDPGTGDVAEWAEGVVDELDTFAEVSPSGTGAHALGFGFLPDGGNRDDVDGEEGHIEMYDEGRYLTVTGHRLDGSAGDLSRFNDELESVHTEYIADTDPEQADLSDTNPTLNGSGSGSGDVDIDDDELIERAKSADNGEKFERLWNGSDAGYPSQSEADMALASMLAFWTGGDRSRTDRLFRQSGLMREKWDEDRGSQTYGERTVEKAVSSRSEVYEGRNGHSESVDLKDVPEPPETESDDTGTGAGSVSDLTPMNVKAYAGLDEDAEIDDLNDRQKAACVWELIYQCEGSHIRVRRDNGSLWSFDGTYWKPEGERTLRHAAREALGPMNYGSNVLKELKAQARSDPRVELEADDFGLDTGEVCVENGIVDLEKAHTGGDGALRPAEPEDYALTRLPVEYDPSAEYDEWHGYVDEWTESGRTKALQEYVGYCLHIGDMPIDRALLVVGSGANGKGTFLHVVRGLLGEENTGSTELQTLANEKDARADFYGKIANIDDDLSARQIGSGLGMFKKLTAGDRVRARRLYEEGFEYEATGKHLYAANEVPDVTIPDDDEAFWRRWLLVEFPNHYAPSERDSTIRDTFTADGRLSGVLNWAIEGWARLMDQGYFTNEEMYAAEKRQRWQAWGESVDEFIQNCVERDESADALSTTQVYERYREWCRVNQKDPVGQQKLTNKLKNEPIVYGRHRIPSLGGNVKRGYKAIGLSDDVPASSSHSGGDDGDDGGDRQGTIA